MSRRPRLVATDLDGTLLDATGAVSPRTREVLAAVDEAGVPVVFVTGRPLRWMSDLWPLVGRHGVAVLSNGAVVWDVTSGRAVRTTGIEREAGRALLETVRAAVPGAAFAVERLSGLAHEPTYAVRDDVPGATAVDDLDVAWDEPAVKVLVRGDEVDPDRLHAAVAAAVGDSAVATWSMPGMVEVSAAGVTKAAALAHVADDLGVDAADVVAFGDMPNDVAMLRWAGTSYAMAGAHPDATAAADRVAPPHDEDGVAQVLADLFDLPGTAGPRSGVMGA